MSTKPLNVYVCFDDDDFEIVNLIEQHCASLVHTKKIDVWHHQKIRPGQLVEHERRIHLDNADIILLMISSKLLNTEEFYEVEKVSMNRLRNRQALVIPVLLKYAHLYGFEFTELQMLPSDEEPVMNKDGNLDLRCKEVAIEIHRLVETLDEIEYSSSSTKIDLNIPFRTNSGIIPILYLTNNPDSADPTSVNEEISTIKKRLLLGKCSCQYELIPKNFMTLEELQRALLETRPRIVHFSGYATDDDQILFVDTNGQRVPIDSEALCSLFKIFNDSIELVFLNNCYSEEQAKALSNAIKYVIGVAGPISRQTSLAFVSGFYQAISYGTSLHKAYRLGRNHLQLKGSDTFDKVNLLENVELMHTT